jgi:hypothetical protein
MSYSQTKELHVPQINLQDDEFIVSRLNLTHQYDSLYSRRLTLFFPLLKQAAAQKYPNVRFVDKLIDINVKSKESKCIIGGIVYKDSKKRPNIIKIFQTKRNLANIWKRQGNFVDEVNDIVSVEDSSSRVELEHIQTNLFVTGVSICCYGELNEEGHFVVQDVISLDFPPQIHRYIHSVEDSNNVDTHTNITTFAFLSDIRIGSTLSNPLSLQLLTDYFNRDIDSDSKAILNELPVPSHICISGSSLVPNKPIKRQFEEFSIFAPENIISPIKDLDAFLCQLCGVTSVSLMPGLLCCFVKSICL